MPDKKQTIEVKGTVTTVLQVDEADYISLTNGSKRLPIVRSSPISFNLRSSQVPMVCRMFAAQ